MKRFWILLFVMALLLSAVSCKETGTDTPGSDAPETSAESETDVHPLEAGTKVADLTQEDYELIIQQTALAYYYANPNCQYDFDTPTTILPASSGGSRLTSRFAPESTSEEYRYYGVCRSFVADVFWNAFAYQSGGLDGTTCTWDNGCPMWVIGGRYGSRLVKEDQGKLYTDHDQFIADAKAGIRTGDVILATDNSGRAGHVLLYIGDCFGNGTDYVIHCWPLSGGTWDSVSGKEGEEKNGAIALQPAEQCIFSKGGNPNWNLDDPNMIDIIIYRYYNGERMQQAKLTDAARERYNHRNLFVKKESSAGMYDEVLERGRVTITDVLQNQGEEDYTVKVTEHVPEGMEYVSAAVNGAEVTPVVEGNDVTWTVRVPAFETTSVSYTLRATAEAGTEIRIPCGAVGLLPTREVRFRISAGRLSPEQENAITRIKTAIPEALDTGSFRDMDFLNAFYETVCGFSPNFPATFQEYLDAMYKSERPPYVDTQKMLMVKEEIEAKYEPFRKMQILRLNIGKWLYLPDITNHPDRANFFRESDFQPGDVFVVMTGSNYLSVTDPAGLKFYVYLGGGSVLEHSTEGTKVVSYSESVALLAINNFSLALRPSYYYDPETGKH